MNMITGRRAAIGRRDQGGLGGFDGQMPQTLVGGNTFCWRVQV